MISLIRLVNLFAHVIFMGKKWLSLDMLLLILCIVVKSYACFVLFYVSTLIAIKSKPAQLL